MIGMTFFSSPPLRGGVRGGGLKNMRLLNDKKLKTRRQYLRNNCPKTERIIWRELSKSKTGFKFRRQTSIGPYIVDFYCPQLKLIIELDGEIHFNAKQQLHDKAKDAFLKKEGFIVWRFSNIDVMDEWDNILDRIKKLEINTNV
jgi:very-short-patch-repair endonuclease